MRHVVLAIALLEAVVITNAQPAQNQQPATPERPTFRAATTLATIDAVVTDKDGRHVTDLTPADFEIKQKGEPRVIRQVAYVELRRNGAPVPLPYPADVARSPDPPGAPAPRPHTSLTIRPRPDERTRVIAVVVDDLGLSFESMYSARRAVRHFVDEQIQPGDLVAILRTSGGVGALQQFTTDKRLLLAAVDRMQWTILSRSGITAFTPVSKPGVLGEDTMSGSGTAEATDEDDISGLRTSMMTTATFSALEYIVRGIQTLPGRKAVVFLSEGFRLFGADANAHGWGSSREWNAFVRLMDRANRAGVVVYCVDPRGLQTAGLTAEDNPQVRDDVGIPTGTTVTAGPTNAPGGSGAGAGSGAGMSPLAGLSAWQQRIVGSGRSRLQFLLDTQQALSYMAEQTGGFAVLNTNDISAAVGRVLRDLDGYYLIGYDAPDQLSRGWEPGNVTVRVKRPGLRVRARRGLFGPADRGAPAEPISGDPLIMAALSPFDAGSIDVRLTPLFGHDPKTGPYVHTLFFVDPNGLRFTTTADGRHEAALDVLLLAIGDNGRVAAQWRRQFDLRLDDEQVRRARERGLLFNPRLPFHDRGAYQVRAAIRDRATGALGSASQFLEVPQVGSGKLALSGVLLKGVTRKGDTRDVVARAPGFLADDVLLQPTVRVVEPGTKAIYTYEIYDGLGKGELTMSTSLVRNGKRVYESAEAPIHAAAARQKVRTIPIGGSLDLGADVPPGPYSLQVTVKQKKNGKVVRRASQWVDFEVR